MNEEEELKRWQQMVIELFQTFTLEHIANHVGVSTRQVSNWKAGTDRPKGFNAVRLYLFHVKHGTVVQTAGTPVHSQEEKQSAVS